MHYICVIPILLCCYNTFLFSQVSPFKVKRNMLRFQLSPTTSYNIGLYGKNEGGEHTQKIVKEHYYKWTNKKKHWMQSLVNQHIEVYVGGNRLWLIIFPDYSPAPKDLNCIGKKKHTLAHKTTPKINGT